MSERVRSSFRSHLATSESPLFSKSFVMCIFVCQHQLEARDHKPKASRYLRQRLCERAVHVCAMRARFASHRHILRHNTSNTTHLELKYRMALSMMEPNTRIQTSKRTTTAIYTNITMRGKISVCVCFVFRSVCARGRIHNLESADTARKQKHYSQRDAKHTHGCCSSCVCCAVF